MPRADWVYRPHMRQLAAATINFADLLGTYDTQFVTVATGSDNAVGHILYDSTNRMGNITGASSAVPGGAVVGLLPGEARAERQGPLILAVQGQVVVEASSWLAGATVQAGFRLGAFEQVPGNGALSLDANYNMWANPINFELEQSQWANDARRNWKEWRFTYQYTDGGMSAIRTFFFFWRGVRRLMPNECLALYHENNPTGVATRTQLWLRTLVAIE